MKPEQTVPLLAEGDAKAAVRAAVKGEKGKPDKRPPTLRGAGVCSMRGQARIMPGSSWAGPSPAAGAGRPVLPAYCLSVRPAPQETAPVLSRTANAQPGMPGQVCSTCNATASSTGSGTSNGRSGPPSQSPISNLPRHSRQTTYSTSNLSYGPQSRPCVSTVLAIRHSPNDEPQSGHAIVRYPLHFNHLQVGRDSPGRGLRARREPFLEESSKWL
jgi:hypothetical protein